MKFQAEKYFSEKHVNFEISIFFDSESHIDCIQMRVLKITKKQHMWNKSSAFSDNMKIDFPGRTNILKFRENFEKLCF